MDDLKHAMGIVEEERETDVEDVIELVEETVSVAAREFLCCSVLQCGAVCCSVLQCVAVCCSALCRVIELVEETVSLLHVSVCGAVCCRVLQCVVCGWVGWEDCVCCRT